MKNIQEQDWPEPEPNNNFDWQLTMSQIEKKYKPIAKEHIGTPEISVTKSSTEIMFKRRLMQKYPFAYACLQLGGYDMAGWVYRNLIAQSL